MHTRLTPQACSRAGAAHSKAGEGEAPQPRHSSRSRQLGDANRKGARGQPACRVRRRAPLRPRLRLPRGVPRGQRPAATGAGAGPATAWLRAGVHVRGRGVTWQRRIGLRLCTGLRLRAQAGRGPRHGAAGARPRERLLAWDWESLSRRG